MSLCLSVPSLRPSSPHFPPRTKSYLCSCKWWMTRKGGRRGREMKLWGKQGERMESCLSAEKERMSPTTRIQKNGWFQVGAGRVLGEPGTSVLESKIVPRGEWSHIQGPRCWCERALTGKNGTIWASDRIMTVMGYDTWVYSNNQREREKAGLYRISADKFRKSLL